MSGAVSIALLAAMAAGRPIIPPRKLRPAANPSPMATANFTLTASPATITFTTTSNPGANPVIAGSATASLTWNALSIFDSNNWTLTIQATGATFTNCPFVPVSAVTVTCSTATVSGSGGTAKCSGAFPLSTTAKQVAGGVVGSVYSYSYAVNINFTLADSWKYIAEQSPACSLSLSYVANVP
ncbi:MAG TPA: hypothetical protein VLW65_22185 [Bryobacteraceae bacterium]|nr:hypothetical protein [Bryobacteraceae bacterium]